MLRALVVLLVPLVGCATAASSHPSPAAVRPPNAADEAPENHAPSVDILSRALPSVVLLLAARPDGTTGYGSGLIVSHDGLVITNLHVVAQARSLTALMYRKDRLSYTPMDGGLARYLFENQKELVPARLVRGDTTSDLALVKLDAHTSQVPLLALSDRDIQPGEASPRAWSARATTAPSSTMRR